MLRGRSRRQKRCAAHEGLSVPSDQWNESPELTTNWFMRDVP